jgi:hypothetical protein
MLNTRQCLMAEISLCRLLPVSLQGKSIKALRVTLAEDPLVTFKNVFAGTEALNAPDPDFGGARPLTAGARGEPGSTVQYGSPGRETPGGGSHPPRLSPEQLRPGSRPASRSARAAREGRREEPGRDGDSGEGGGEGEGGGGDGAAGTFLAHNGAELREAAEEMVLLEMLSNRDLADALAAAGGDVDAAWRAVCARALAPGAAEALADERARRPARPTEDVEPREHGVAGLRRVHAQCAARFDPCAILPRADRVAGVTGCLDAVLSPAPLPAPRTKWTRRVPHSVQIGHAASLTPYSLPRPSTPLARPAPVTPPPLPPLHRRDRIPAVHASSSL